jgi:hypothetical protein
MIEAEEKMQRRNRDSFSICPITFFICHRSRAGAGPAMTNEKYQLIYGK